MINPLKPLESDWEKPVVFFIGRETKHLARELELDLFLSVKNSVWMRNTEYDYTLIYQMLHRGLSLEQVMRFYEWFNLGLREKIEEGDAKEANGEVVEGMKAVGRI